MRAKYEGGAKIIVADPRRTELADRADLWLRLRPGTNVSLLNSIAHVIVREGLADNAFIGARTENFAAFAANLDGYAPEQTARTTGVEPELVRRAARMYAKGRRGMVLWGMGITQHLKGVDGALAMANLSLLTGQIGRPGTGIMPLRGQCNVQGASDMQGLDNALPGYHSIADPAARAKFEQAWGVELPRNELSHHRRDGVWPRQQATSALCTSWATTPWWPARIQARLRRACVISTFWSCRSCSCPRRRACRRGAPGRGLSPKRTAPSRTPSGACSSCGRPSRRLARRGRDWQIVCDVSTALGYPMTYPNAAAIMEEIASLVPAYAGIRHERLTDGGLQWPCPSTSHPGTRYLYSEKFPTESGRASFTALSQQRAIEDVSDDFPLIVDTGRLLEHYDTGTMTRRSRGLNHLRPYGEIEISPQDAWRYGLETGDRARLSTRRGSIEALVRITGRLPEGMVFYPFHFPEQPASRLVSAAFDEASHTPAFKGAAARIERVK